MPTEAQPDSSPCYTSHRQQILAIDDERSMLILLSTILKDSFDVIAHRDGLAGMSWLYGGHLPSLIIMDLSLPRLPGYEFLVQIKKSGFFRHIPVIVLSQNKNDILKNKCINAGANAFLEKPFNPNQIKDLIADLTTTTITD